MDAGGHSTAGSLAEALDWLSAAADAKSAREPKGVPCLRELNSLERVAELLRHHSLLGMERSGGRVASAGEAMTSSRSFDFLHQLAEGDLNLKFSLNQLSRLRQKE